MYDSRDFVVVVAKPGDTAEGLAARYLGDPKKKWMIEDYMGARTFSEGQEVVIPKREWNPVGVFPWGYQLVPVLVYHNVGAEDKGKLSIGVRRFEAQMRSLHAEGFHAVSLVDFLEFTAGRRQLPRKSVLLTFDDGYRGFIQYARPMLKDLGFNATLFVYSDFIGAGNGLSWSDLRALITQGFDVQAHSKTHGNLRRKEEESQGAYAKRVEAELAYPLELFRKNLGRPVDTLAYPYGDTDEEVLQHVAKYGYVAAFTVRRQSNPAFVFPLKISRSQIYSEMTPKDFTRNLAVTCIVIRVTFTLSMCPYRDTWVMSQKARAALKYMRGVGAEPRPPRLGPSSQAKLWGLAPSRLTVASLRNGVTDVTSASNVICRVVIDGSRPSGNRGMAHRLDVKRLLSRTVEEWRDYTRGHEALQPSAV